MAEAGGEALEEGLGQSDLGQQHQRLPPKAQGFGHRLEIDFGLARSGDSVEQEGHEIGAPNRLDEDVRRRALRKLQLGRRMVRVGEREGIVHRDLSRLDRSGLDQSADHPVRNPGGDRKLAHQALALADPLQRLSPLGGQALGNEAGGSIFGDRPTALERARRGQCHSQHRGERGEIIIRGPFDQPPQRCSERREVVGLEQRPKAIVAHRFGIEPILLPHHARQLPRPERSEHDRPGSHRHALRHPIVERPQGGIEQEDSAAVHESLDRVAGD
jgi:hypothetical protein